MKRKIVIAAIALLVVLGAWFAFKRQTEKGTATTNPEPEVSRFGTLINLKDDKGRRLFSSSIQEGFYVRYRVNDGKEQIIYAIGDRIVDPKVSYSGYQEKISGAGITTQNGLNVTSGFVVDKSKGTLRAIRTIVNISKEQATIHLSEVKNYFDTKLLALRTETGTAKVVYMIHDDCWPCQTWPDCELGNVLPDPTKATVICINCEKNATGVVHVVCLADLEKELAEYKEEGCEHLITYTGIDASGGNSFYDEDCPAPLAKEKSASGVGTPAADRKLSESDVRRLLTLPAKAAIVLTTEYKIILPRK